MWSVYFVHFFFSRLFGRSLVRFDRSFHTKQEASIWFVSAPTENTANSFESRCFSICVWIGDCEISNGIFKDYRRRIVIQSFDHRMKMKRKIRGNRTTYYCYCRCQSAHRIWNRAKRRTTLTWMKWNGDGVRERGRQVTNIELNWSARVNNTRINSQLKSYVHRNHVPLPCVCVFVCGWLTREMNRQIRFIVSKSILVSVWRIARKLVDGIYFFRILFIVTNTQTHVRRTQNRKFRILNQNTPPSENIPDNLSIFIPRFVTTKNDSIRSTTRAEQNQNQWTALQCKIANWIRGPEFVDDDCCGDEKPHSEICGNARALIWLNWDSNRNPSLSGRSFPDKSASLPIILIRWIPKIFSWDFRRLSLLLLLSLVLLVNRINDRRSSNAFKNGAFKHRHKCTHETHPNEIVCMYYVTLYECESIEAMTSIVSSLCLSPSTVSVVSIFFSFIVNDSDEISLVVRVREFINSHSTMCGAPVLVCVCEWYPRQRAQKMRVLSPFVSSEKQWETIPIAPIDRSPNWISHTTNNFTLMSVTEHRHTGHTHHIKLSFAPFKLSEHSISSMKQMHAQRHRRDSNSNCVCTWMSHAEYIFIFLKVFPPPSVPFHIPNVK